MKRRIAACFPWLLYLCTFPMLFYMYNELDAPSQPYESQSASDIAQQAQTGDVLNRFVVLGLALIGVSLLLLYKRRLHPQPLIARILFPFLAWNVVTALWSVDPALSVRRLVSLIFVVTFCAGCALRMNTFSLSLFIATNPALTILPGLWAEIRYGTFHPFSSGYRFGGTAPHPNVQAANLAFATILLFWISWLTRGKMRVFSSLAALFVGVFLVLCGSRTSLVAVLAALAFSAILVLVRDYKQRIPVVIAFVCLLTAAATLGELVASSAAPTSTFSSLKHQDEASPTTLNGRLDLWNSLLTYAAKRPLGGYGFGSFWSPQRIEIISAEQGWAIQQSHSAYIEELLALGIPGAIMYILLLYSSLVWCVTQFVRYRSGYGAFAAVFLFIAIHDATEGIDVGSSFTSTAFYMMVLYLALTQPGDPEAATTAGSPTLATDLTDERQIFAL